jgi:hypothetical protein
MARIAHHARSAPTPNADDFSESPLHVEPSSLVINVKQILQILIGPYFDDVIASDDSRLSQMVLYVLM